MFDLDKWQEILSTLRKNRLRTFLTSFSVAWGILLLVILLGVGNGFKNAVLNNFEDDAKNSIFIWGGRTSMAYKGMSANRWIDFTNSDFDNIKQHIEGIDHISAQFNIWGGSRASYKTEYGDFTIRSVYPDYCFIEKIPIVEGRFINEIDMKENRKVVTIGRNVVKVLFKKENPIGKSIDINGIAFKVVGIYEEQGAENNSIYAPFLVAQRIFKGGVDVHSLSLTTGKASVEENKAIEKKIKEQLARTHRFDPNDPSAVWIQNTLENYKEFLQVFSGIEVFLWLIGLGTIISGVVGVSNIMMIVVKERTREIGIRKAIGATPFSVVSLIISESIFITTIAGYVGLVLGVGIMEIVDYFLDKSIASAVDTTDAFGDTVMFMNPNADIRIAIGATVLLIISGAIAGLIPSIKAAKIKPIEALNG